MCFFAQYRKLIIYLKEFACFIFRSNKIRISTKRLIFEIYLFYNKAFFIYLNKFACFKIRLNKIVISTK